MDSNKRYTKEQILNFKEDDWNFRRSSGYAGYDHNDTPGDEQSWIYEEDYNARRHLKAEYERDYNLIVEYNKSIEFEKTKIGCYPDYVIQEFLNKKYFKES